MNCDYCGHTVEKDGAYAIAAAAKTTSHYCWEADTITTKFGQLTLVEKSDNPMNQNSYGELPQGTTFEAYKIYKLGSRYFKKTGSGDSYGEVTWDGPFAEVKAVPQSVVTYEYLEK